MCCFTVSLCFFENDTNSSALLTSVSDAFHSVRFLFLVLFHGIVEGDFKFWKMTENLACLNSTILVDKGVKW